MKVIIEAEAKEIADLVSALQGQRRIDENESPIGCIKEAVRTTIHGTAQAKSASL